MLLVKGAATFITQRIARSAHTYFRVRKVSQVKKTSVPLCLTLVANGHLSMGTVVAGGHGMGYYNP